MNAAARALLESLARSMLVARKLGRAELVDTWHAAFTELCETEALRSATQQLDAIEHAARVSADEALEIGRSVTAAAGVSGPDAERLHQHLASAPAHIARQCAAIRRHVLPGNSLATVLPLDVHLHGEAARSDLVRRLVPGEPRYRAGERVPNRPGWTFEAFLGAGSQGEVWRVAHPDHAEPQAIKLCHDEVSADQLRREAHNLATLQRTLGEHRNIVSVREVNVASSPAWIAMDLVSGGTLEDWIRARGPADERPVLELWRRVCTGIAAAHSRGLVHRDLKPANILLDPDGTPRVADFGIGTVATSSIATLLTRAQSVHGLCTALYASPEQRLGAPADPTDDVYALGVVLFQMLVGSPRAVPPHRIARAFETRARWPSDVVFRVIESCIDTRAHRPRDAGALLQILDGEAARALDEMPWRSWRELGPPAPSRFPSRWVLVAVLLGLAVAGGTFARRSTAPPDRVPAASIPVDPAPPAVAAPSPLAKEIEVPGFTFLRRCPFACPNDVEGLRQYEIAVYRCDAMYAGLRGELATGDPAIDTEFVLLPPEGRSTRFMMGSPDDELHREFDEHRIEVMITPFLIARTELTRRVFAALGGRTSPSRGPGAGPTYPRDGIGWDEAVALGARFGLRLPNEAQWEFACRGGTGTAYAFGNSLPSRSGSDRDLVYRARPVASIEWPPANAFGLFDMHGNAWEWCDTFRGFAPFLWPTGAILHRPIRGGYSVPWVAWLSRSSDRNWGETDRPKVSTTARFTGVVR